MLGDNNKNMKILGKSLSKFVNMHFLHLNLSNNYPFEEENREWLSGLWEGIKSLS